MINIKRVFILCTVLSCFFIAENSFAQKTETKVNAFDKDGKRHGNWKKYYQNGRLRYTGNFLHGKEVGAFMYFRYRKLDITMILNGALGGLVAVTAGPDLYNIYTPILNQT